MIRTMYSATNTMTQLQNKLDMVSNNIANSNTTGFKARNATFGEFLNQQFTNDVKDQAERQSPAGIRIGIGAQIAQTKLNTKVGSMAQTGRKLDFALQNENQYFAVNSPDSEQLLLTRQGNFYLSPNEDGSANLVNSEGHSVADSQGQAIVFAQDISDLTITADGTMSISYADGSNEAIDLAVVQVDKPNLLEQDNGKYLRYSEEIEAMYPDAGNVARLLNDEERVSINVQGGMLEGSNVDLSKEMSELINTQRSYQFNARTVTMADQMLGLINNVR